MNSRLFGRCLIIVRQRVFKNSRMRKSYRVLNILRKKFFLLFKREVTLICKKSVPFFFVATVSSLIYLLCLKLEMMDWFETLLSKVGLSSGGSNQFFVNKILHPVSQIVTSISPVPCSSHARFTPGIRKYLGGGSDTGLGGMGVTNLASSSCGSNCDNDTGRTENPEG